MVRLACELAGAQGATLFVAAGPVLRPFIIYNLPKEYRGHWNRECRQPVLRTRGRAQKTVDR